MRSSHIRILGLIGVASALACADTRSPCGSDGTFIDDEDGDGYCVYSVASPIVIEGGFTCPSAMRFELPLPRDGYRVCSAHAFDGAEPPSALCEAMPQVCVSSDAPGRPGTLPESVPLGSMDPQPGGPNALERDPVSWTECDARTYEEGLSGDACGPEVLGCGMTGSCLATFAICDPGGTLIVSELEILECATPVVDPDAPVIRGAAECEAALEDGHTYQVCEGPFVCARQTEDPCCVEYALCTEPSPLSDSDLMRYRFCELGCTNVEPDETMAPVTDCSAFVADPELAHMPCAGDFLCWNDQDVSGGLALTSLEPGWLRWCSEGVVRGQHSTLAYVWLPTPPI